MWYRFVKINENPLIAEYEYSYESKETTGLLEFNKKTQEITIPKLALRDDGTQVNRFGGAFIRKVLEENFPEIVFLAFG